MTASHSPIPALTEAATRVISAKLFEAMRKMAIFSEWKHQTMHTYFPYLADNGKKRVEELIRKSNEKIRIIMKDLSDDENKRLADGFNTITAILIREKG